MDPNRSVNLLGLNFTLTTSLHLSCSSCQASLSTTSTPSIWFKCCRLSFPPWTHFCSSNLAIFHHYLSSASGHYPLPQPQSHGTGQLRHHHHISPQDPPGLYKTLDSCFSLYISSKIRVPEKERQTRVTIANKGSFCLKHSGWKKKKFADWYQPTKSNGSKYSPYSRDYRTQLSTCHWSCESILKAGCLSQFDFLFIYC